MDAGAANTMRLIVYDYAMQNGIDVDTPEVRYAFEEAVKVFDRTRNAKQAVAAAETYLSDIGARQAG